MQISIRGISKSKLTAPGVKRAVNFYATRLGISSRLAKKLSLNIIIEHKPFGYAGLCNYGDDHIRPKEFRLRILDQGIHETLCTLAHEMVHVKQYAKGELRDLMSKDNMVVWQGERRFISNDTEEAYLSQPWEQEAFGLEKKLKNAFVYQEQKHGTW